LPGGAWLRYIPIMNSYRVLIVADDPLARAGLTALLAGQDGCTVVGQVAGDDRLADNLDVYRPDVLIWDLGWDPDPAALPDLGGGLPVIAPPIRPGQQCLDGGRASAAAIADAAPGAAIAAGAQGLRCSERALAGSRAPWISRPPRLSGWRTKRLRGGWRSAIIR
jgi:hypothetical protein